MDEKELFGTMSDGLSIIQDPFNKDCITDIIMHMSSYYLLGKRVTEFSGKVVFRKGNTGGKQSFCGENLSDVFLKIRDFCANLP